MSSVSLCVIARNEATNLPACLGPLLPFVGETIVVDTGSTDGTRAVAESMGARVFDFAWCDDFAAARNESLRRATSDWILWMDADDRVDAANAARLGDLLRCRRRDGGVHHEVRQRRRRRSLFCRDAARAPLPQHSRASLDGPHPRADRPGDRARRRRAAADRHRRAPRRLPGPRALPSQAGTQPAHPRTRVRDAGAGRVVLLPARRGTARPRPVRGGNRVAEHRGSAPLGRSTRRAPTRCSRKPTRTSKTSTSLSRRCARGSSPWRPPRSCGCSRRRSSPPWATTTPPS